MVRFIATILEFSNEEDPTGYATWRDAAEPRLRERSNGVGGDPCDKLIFIASWVAALSIGR